MAITAITTELLTVNTRSADLPFIAGGGSANAIVATTAADGFVISPPSGLAFDERLVLILGADGSGGTFTFKASSTSRYPGQRVDLGDLVITLAANDGRVLSIETSRFITNADSLDGVSALAGAGNIVCIPSATGIVMTAIMLPKGP